MRRMPNKSLERTRPSRLSCNRSVHVAGSLSFSLSGTEGDGIEHGGFFAGGAGPAEAGDDFGVGRQGALRTGKESLFPARPSPHHPPRQPARWVGDAGGSPTFFMYRFLGMIKLL